MRTVLFSQTKLWSFGHIMFSFFLVKIFCFYDKPNQMLRKNGRERKKEGGKKTPRQTELKGNNFSLVVLIKLHVGVNYPIIKVRWRMRKKGKKKQTRKKQKEHKRPVCKRKTRKVVRTEHVFGKSCPTEGRRKIKVSQVRQRPRWSSIIH